MSHKDAAGFVLLSDVVPDVFQELRYYTTYNFIGERVDGYLEPVALMTEAAAQALGRASEALLGRGYRLKIYDAYRPARAVRRFTRWALEEADERMKPYFYPDLDKRALIDEGYIARRSSHSRGSAVDLTLFDMGLGREADMGGPFDLFGERSHPDFRGVTGEQYARRRLLASVMEDCGFEPYEREWWHFRLIDEPFPNTWFDFPVARASVEE